MNKIWCWIFYFAKYNQFTSMYTRQFFSFLSQASQEGFWSKWWHDSRTCPNREKQFLLFLEIWQRKIAKVEAMYAKRIFRILLLFAFVLNFTHKNKRSGQVFWVYHFYYLPLRIFQGVKQQSSCPEKCWMMTIHKTNEIFF